MNEPKLRMVHERHPDWGWWDKIEIVTTPRWKESEMSGDEWRKSGVIRLWFKGALFVEKSFHTVETAAAFLPGILKQGLEDIRGDDSKKYFELEELACDNPGCALAWEVRYRMKKLWSPNCSMSEDPDPNDAHYRQFCDRHKHRGDCGLDDTDANYELLEKRRQPTDGAPV